MSTISTEILAGLMWRVMFSNYIQVKQRYTRIYFGGFNPLAGGI